MDEVALFNWWILDEFKLLSQISLLQVLPMPWFLFKCCRCNEHQAFIGSVRSWIRICLSKLLSIYTDNQNKYMHSLWFYDLQGYLFLFLHYKDFVDFILEMEKKNMHRCFWVQTESKCNF